MTEASLFTIGHSNRTLEEFLQLLNQNQITLLVDVRKLTGSRRYPHFNAEALEDSLAAEGITYRLVEPLAGRRPVNHEIPDEINGWWSNRSFHNYADHATTAEFRDGLEQVRDWSRTNEVVVMCSEAVWWRCHRRIIADHLLARGDQVRHILGNDQVTEAELSEGAVVTDDSLTYPATTK